MDSDFDPKDGKKVAMHLTLPERKETQSNKQLLFRANTKPVGELRCLSPLREDVNSSTCLEERDRAIHC